MSEYTESKKAKQIKRAADQCIGSYYEQAMIQVIERKQTAQKTAELQKRNQALRNDLRNTGRV